MSASYIRNLRRGLAKEFGIPLDTPLVRGPTDLLVTLAKHHFKMRGRCNDRECGFAEALKEGLHTDKVIVNRWRTFAAVYTPSGKLEIRYWMTPRPARVWLGDFDPIKNIEGLRRFLRERSFPCQIVFAAVPPCKEISRVLRSNQRYKRRVRNGQTVVHHRAAPSRPKRLLPLRPIATYASPNERVTKSKKRARH